MEGWDRLQGGDRRQKCWAWLCSGNTEQTGQARVLSWPPLPDSPALNTQQELWASWVNTLHPEKFPGRHPTPSYLHFPFISNNSTAVKRRLSLQRWKIRSWNINPCVFLSVQPFLTFPLLGRSIYFACRRIKSCYDWKSESQERLFFRIFLSTQGISEN